MKLKPGYFGFFLHTKIILDMIKNSAWRKLTKGSKILLFSLVLFGCSEDPVLWEVKSKDQVISDYIATHDQFSEFKKILESTGLNSLLSVRGPFTLFLPSDSVMKLYYTEKGVNSFTEFTDPDFIRRLVLNHLVNREISSGEIGLGAIRDTNSIGDYLVTEFQGADIIINKQSKIIDRDVPAANGTIHIIDKVIDPVTINVFDLIANNPSFSLFAEGLRRTKLNDTLKVTSFPYGKKVARTRFTILAVADTTFNRYGITNIDELIAYFTDAPDSVSYMKNEFYRFMEYHCMGGTFFLNNFSTRLYPILSYDNNISVTIDTDYKLNYNSLTKKYTGFVIDQSNYPAKNGTIHTINDLLTVIEPEPTVITFETTDYFDIKQGDYYLKYYMKWFDGQNTFAKIKWEGTYLQYYYKNHDAPTQVNFDCLNMSGYWWLEVTTPKAMNGKYALSGYIWGGPQYNCYVDGVQTATITSGDNPKLGEFEWTTTEEHKIRLVATSPCLIFWDTIVLTPIK